MSLPAGSQNHNGALAARIVTAPNLREPAKARARVADWLRDLPPSAAGALKALLAAHPKVSALLESLAESAPFLWDLASAEPERLLRLLACNTAAHAVTLRHLGQVWSGMIAHRGEWVGQATLPRKQRQRCTTCSGRLP